MHVSMGGHFHLCVGETMGPSFAPASPEVRTHRKPSRAVVYRGLLETGNDSEKDRELLATRFVKHLIKRWVSSAS
jgi:hypothetical protein